MGLHDCNTKHTWSFENKNSYTYLPDRVLLYGKFRMFMKIFSKQFFNETMSSSTKYCRDGKGSLETKEEILPLGFDLE